MSKKRFKKKLEPKPEPPKKIECEPGTNIGDGKQLFHLLPKHDYHSTWDSPEAYAKYIETLNPKYAWLDAGWQGDHDFHGTKNMKEALDLARYGWKEGADQVEKLRSRIHAANPKAPKLILHGIAGTTPNVPRAVAGNIFNMRQPDLARSRKKPVITLVANMSANCGINKDMISNRSAVIAAIIDEIENAGYSCEVIATAMSKGGGWWNDGNPNFRAATSILVKPSSQPVDTIRLAFALGHASLFRRFVFADWGSEPSCKAGLGRGLGNAGGGFDAEKEELKEKSIYLLPSAETKSEYFHDSDVAMDKGLPYLIQYLKDEGCPVFRDTPDWKDPDVEPPSLNELEPTEEDDDD